MKIKILHYIKAIVYSTLLLSMSLLITNCSKDDTPPNIPVVAAPLQDPLPGFLVATGFNQITDPNVNNGDYELGFSFIPLVNGKITAIVVKIPDVRADLRVTIWDKVAGTILKTEIINIATANVEVLKQITPLDLVKDKEYFITYNSNDWYDRYRTNNASVSYPFIIEDIKITSFAYTIGTAQVIPSSIRNDFYAGDCSFKFQK